MPSDSVCSDSTGSRIREAGALPRRAIHLDAAAAAAHKTVYRRKAQAPSGEFGAEEGIENLLLQLLIHTATVVPHFQRNVGARGHRGQRGFGYFLDGGANCNDAGGAFADTLRCVPHKVYDDLAHLPCIDEDGGAVPGRPDVDLNGLRNRGTQGIAGFADQSIQVGALHVQRTFARVREHFAGEFGRAFAGANHTLQHAPRLVAGRDGLQRITGAAENHHQQVVEIVRDSGGKLTDSLQLLCLQVTHFGLLVVLDLRAGPKPTGDLPGGRAKRNRAHQMPAITAVGGPLQPVFDFEYGPGLPRLLPGSARALPILRVKKVIPLPGIARACVTRVVEPLPVGVGNAALSGRHPHHVGDRFQQGLVLRGTALQRGSLLVDAPLHLESLNRVDHRMRQNVGRDVPFRQVVHSPALHGVDGQRFASARGEHHHGAGKTLAFVTQGGQHVEPVHVGEVEIKEDAVGRPLPAHPDAGRSAIALGELELVGRRKFEIALVNLAVDPLIFHDQNFPHPGFAHPFPAGSKPGTVPKPRLAQ